MEKLFTDANLLNNSKLWIESVLGGHIPEETVLKITIIFNEVVQNIYRYTYQMEQNKELRCTVEKTGHLISFIIRDFGKPCHDQTFLQVNHIASEKGGIGLKIIKEGTEIFEIIPKEDGNLTKVVISI
jgi:anti-sigma regulatory factor (Ser/Thr protein kinase)